MEILILVVVVVAFFWLRANIAQGFSDQELLMGILKQDIAALRTKLENMGAVAADKAKVAERPASEHQTYMPPVVRTQEAVVPKPAEAEPAPIAQAKAEPVIAATPRPPVVPRPVEVEERPSFFERHPDLEKFVGENLMNKIGIAILVLGIGFFVKYAIDKEWINEIGRMAIGILAGGLLLGIAHRLRLSLAAFSSVLVGGGLSVLYFSIGIGFHDYHLLSQTAAFGVMVLITAFAVALSVLYNRKELAVIALVGGFGTPFFLSTGEGNYQVLFTYLLILNVGMTVLAVQKKWGLVNLLSYIFTVLIYGGWLATKGGTIDSPNGGALLFGTLFYLLFFTMNVGFNLKNKAPFKALDITMLVSNSFFYFAAGLVCLKNIHGGDFSGLFTVALGVFNFVFARIVYQNNAIDRNLFYLLVGLVLSFISLAAPIQLKGNYITLFWATESVLLLWLSQKSGIELIKKTSLLVTALMLVSLLMDWGNLYGAIDPLPVFANKAFVTSMVSALALGAYVWLVRRNDRRLFLTTWAWPAPPVGLAYAVAGVLVLYVGIFLEIGFQMSAANTLQAASTLVLSCYTLVFAAVLVWLLRHQNNVGYAALAIGLASVLSLLYMVIFNPAVVDVRYAMVNNLGAGRWVFLMHFVMAAAYLWLLFMAKTKTIGLLRAQDGNTGWVYWVVTFLTVYVLSAELDHVLMWLFFQHGESPDYLLWQNHKFGYLILWALVSFVLMVMGMKRKVRVLRIISLALFGLIIAKLFFVDLWTISKIGKILAFVSLGVLLLVVSFLYQKLKVLLTDDQPVSQQLEE